MKTFTILKGFLSFALISFVLINRTSAQVTTNANPANVNRSVSSTSVISATIVGDQFTSATWADPGSGVTVSATTLSGGNTVASATATFTANGSFTFTMTYTKASTGATSFSTTVTVQVVQLTLSPSTTQNDNQGDFEDFSSNPAGFPGSGAYTYLWQVSPNTGVSFINSTTNTSASPRIQFNSSGSFLVSVTQSRGGVTVTSPQTTVNISTPTITITPSTTQNILEGASVNFGASPSDFGGTGNYSYNWSAPGANVGTNPVSDDASPAAKAISFPTFGTYSVSVTATRAPSVATSPSTTVNVFQVNAGADQLLAGTTASLNGSAAGPGAISYAWTRISGPNTPPISGAATANASLTGLIAGTYVYRLTINGVAALFDEITLQVSPGANLWATSSSGTQISSFSVSNGTYNSGPTNIFAPDGGSTAALGRTDKPSQSTGYFYWLPNNGNNGIVNVYGASAAGNNETLIGTLDLNTDQSNNDMGFVRLCMGPDGKGYILARESNTNAVYLATFMPNGVNPVVISVVDADVTINGGAGSTFVNGDIAVSGNGTMFALANNGSGVTQIFVGLPNGGSTQLTKKWDLIVNANGPGTADDEVFTGTVNGVAFDALGAIYLSCADGLYYLSQSTVNGADGTVVCTLVHEVSGLQDLASNFFPNQTVFPVELISFTGSLRSNITTLRWETENEQNFDHFEIERRTDNAGNYTKIGEKASLGSSSRSYYTFDDNLGSVSGSAFNYRLKIVDQDGKFKYSNIILIRKDLKMITGIMLSPNPVISGIATARFTASADGMVNLHVVDMSGKTVLTQMAKVYEGENSVSINNLDRLQPGIYMLKMEDHGAINTIKFSIAR